MLFRSLKCGSQDFTQLSRALGYLNTGRNISTSIQIVNVLAALDGASNQPHTPALPLYSDAKACRRQEKRGTFIATTSETRILRLISVFHRAVCTLSPFILLYNKNTGLFSRTLIGNAAIARKSTSIPLPQNYPISLSTISHR